MQSTHPAGGGSAQPLTLVRGEGRSRVQVTGLLTGPDLVLVITGGTHPHVGAVSLATPRPSLADPERRSATASVLAVVAHKEDELARWAALQVAAATGAHAVVAAGLHIDQATPAEIAALEQSARELVTEWLNRWGEQVGPRAY